MLILVEGQPGTGKSAGIEGLDPSTTLIIKPNVKDLPFAGSTKLYKEGENTVHTTELSAIRDLLIQANNGTKFKTVVIEDLTHFFNKRTMREAGVGGYEKWGKLAVDIFNSFLDLDGQLRDDLTVIVIAHVEVSRDASGNPVSVLQTPGKLLEKEIKIQSYVNYILHSDIEDGEDGKPYYYFLTNRDGSGREAKSPKGCLELKEPNDYQLIIEKIVKYRNNA